MSGILGIFQKDGSSVNSTSLDTIQSVMAFWGPDGQGRWEQGSVGLAHLMLHVTPESLQERLPLAHPARDDLVITADARLDNRDELCTALDVPPLERHSLPDSALILWAYQKWGKDCPEKLLGAFAFAIWDGRAQTLFCARDHIGFKPFYYYDARRFFVFASDINGVLACPDVPRSLHEGLLAAFLQQDTWTAQQRYSFYRDIVKVPPGHALLVTRTATHLQRYWKLENIPLIRLPSDEAYAERLRELVTEAVRCCLRSAFPIGAHVSGGLDSSSVALLAACALKQRGQTVAGFSWSPPPASVDAALTDERASVAQVCAQEGMRCSYTQVTTEDVLNILSRDFTCEPTEMLIPEQIVQAQARQQQIRVMLSGWGGDECASRGGGDHLPECFWRGRWLRLYHALKTEIGLVEGPWPQVKRLGSLLLGHIALPFLPAGVWGLWNPTAVYSTWPLTFIAPAFAQRMHREVRRLRSSSWLSRPCARATMWGRLSHGHLTGRIEAWETNGARYSLVYRYPLLDRRVVEFCLGIPVEQFYQQRLKRSLFRRAFAGTLPASLLSGEAKPLEPAWMEVVRTVILPTWRMLLEQACTEEHSRPGTTYVDVPRLQKMIEQFTQDYKIGMQGVKNALACLYVRGSSCVSRTWQRNNTSPTTHDPNPSAPINGGHHDTESPTQ